MHREALEKAEDGIVATIENGNDPSQVVAIKYLPDEQAFVTSGITSFFGEKEILMPAHLVIIDFQLMGTIVSAILEKLSTAVDMEQSFEYHPAFEVLGKKYKLTPHGNYMKLFSETDFDAGSFGHE